MTPVLHSSGRSLLSSADRGIANFAMFDQALLWITERASGYIALSFNNCRCNACFMPVSAVDGSLCAPSGL